MKHRNDSLHGLKFRGENMAHAFGGSGTTFELAIKW